MKISTYDKTNKMNFCIDFDINFIIRIYSRESYNSLMAYVLKTIYTRSSKLNEKEAEK